LFGELISLALSEVIRLADRELWSILGFLQKSLGFLQKSLDRKIPSRMLQARTVRRIRRSVRPGLPLAVHGGLASHRIVLLKRVSLVSHPCLLLFPKRCNDTFALSDQHLTAPYY